MTLNQQAMECSVLPFLYTILAFQNATGLTLLHSERPKLYAILAFLSAMGLKCNFYMPSNSDIMFLPPIHMSSTLRFSSMHMHTRKTTASLRICSLNEIL